MPRPSTSLLAPPEVDGRKAVLEKMAFLSAVEIARPSAFDCFAFIPCSGRSFFSMLVVLFREATLSRACLIAKFYNLLEESMIKYSISHKDRKESSFVVPASIAFLNLKYRSETFEINLELTIIPL